jgi:hypothetical protein
LKLNEEEMSRHPNLSNEIIVESFSQVNIDEDGYLSRDSLEQHSVARDLIKNLDNNAMTRFLSLYKESQGDQSKMAHLA